MAKRQPHHQARSTAAHVAAVGERSHSAKKVHRELEHLMAHGSTCRGFRHENDAPNPTPDERGQDYTTDPVTVPNRPLG